MTVYVLKDHIKCKMINIDMSDVYDKKGKNDRER